jgi:hypothetical protein
MTIQSSCVPEASAGQSKPAAISPLAPYGDKRDVARLADMRSLRWVDDQLTKGMPHLRLGKRRVRFDLEEVRAWLKERYGTSRVGPLNDGAEQ